MESDSLEFSISQYLDGNLSAAETAALENRLKDDAAARQMLAEYRKLNDLLNAPLALPAVAWDRFAGHVSEEVREDAEQFEFAISQYADGSLPAEEMAAVEMRIGEDPRGQQLLDEHRKLTAMLKTPTPLPAVRWDRLARHLSDAIAAESRAAVEPKPIRLFARPFISNPWVRAVTGLAMAASVVVVSTIGVRGFVHSREHPPAIVIGPKDRSTPPADSTKFAIVEIGGPEKAAGASVAQISIGAGAGSADPDGPSYAEGIISHSPRSFIAAAEPMAQDTSQMPY